MASATSSKRASRAVRSDQSMTGLPLVARVGEDRGLLWDERRTRRTAEMSWVTVSWVATASSRIVESSALRCFVLALRSP